MASSRKASALKNDFPTVMAEEDIIKELSPERRALLKKIDELRKTIGPLKTDVGELVRKMREDV